jgi:hypothetical protein
MFPCWLIRGFVGTVAQFRAYLQAERQAESEATARRRAPTVAA